MASNDDTNRHRHRAHNNVLGILFVASKSFRHSAENDYGGACTSPAMWRDTYIPHFAAQSSPLSSCAHLLMRNMDKSASTKILGTREITHTHSTHWCPNFFASNISIYFIFFQQFSVFDKRQKSSSGKLVRLVQRHANGDAQNGRIVYFTANKMCENFRSAVVFFRRQIKKKDLFVRPANNSHRNNDFAFHGSHYCACLFRCVNMFNRFLIVNFRNNAQNVHGNFTSQYFSLCWLLPTVTAALWLPFIGKLAWNVTQESNGHKNREVLVPSAVLCAGLCRL